MLHDYMTAESDTQNQCKKRYTFNKHGCSVPKIQFFSLKNIIFQKIRHNFLRKFRHFGKR